MKMLSIEPSSPHTGERLKSCNQCRKNHTKCDGNTPCSYCKLHNTPCEYSFKKKRKQKPSKQELQLQSELLKLKSEYERLQHSERYWKEKYFSQNNSLQHVKSESVLKDDLLAVYSILFELTKSPKFQTYFPTGVLD